MGQAAILVWVWAAAVLFVAGCAWRAWRYWSAPAHLRWDLYPVAHEPRARRAYGGSHLEELEYWTKPQQRSLAGEVATMLEEILFLKGVWLHNRRVFWGSFPFHWGLYLLIATSGLLVSTALGLRSAWLMDVVRVLGAAGGVLLLAGAARLLVLRTTDRGLKRYSSPADRLNLALFAAIGLLSLAVAAGGSGMQEVSRGVGRLLRMQPPGAPRLVAAHMLLAATVLAYFPFTRMVHFFAKYFLYHDVRWDDRPVEAGSAMEARFRRALDFGVSWSAEHAKPGRTWGEVATSNPTSPGGQR